MKLSKLIFTVFITGVFLLLVRMTAPFVVRDLLNQKYKDHSPYFTARVGGVDLNFFHGEYLLKNVIIEEKNSGKEIASGKRVKLLISGKTLFSQKRELDVIVQEMSLKLDSLFVDVWKKEKERMAELRRRGFKPFFHVEYFMVQDSRISLVNLPGELTKIEGFISNLNPTQNQPLSDFKISGEALGPAPFRMEGVVRLRQKPFMWNLDSELKNFSLTSVKDFVRRKTGVVIKGGRMDLYAEAKSEEARTEGYIKPFLRNLDVKIPENSKLDTILAEWLLKLLEDKVPALKIPFSNEASGKPDLMDVLGSATIRNVRPGIEDKIDFKQAQEAN